MILQTMRWLSNLSCLNLCCISFVFLNYQNNTERGAVVKWLEWRSYCAESRHKVVSYSGTLAPLLLLVIRLWETFTFYYSLEETFFF